MTPSLPTHYMSVVLRSGSHPRPSKLVKYHTLHRRQLPGRCADGRSSPWPPPATPSVAPSAAAALIVAAAAPAHTPALCAHTLAGAGWMTHCPRRPGDPQAQLQPPHPQLLAHTTVSVLLHAQQTLTQPVTHRRRLHPESHTLPHNCLTLLTTASCFYGPPQPQQKKLQGILQTPQKGQLAVHRQWTSSRVVWGSVNKTLRGGSHCECGGQCHPLSRRGQCR